ncbi:Gamma carbonic anhydrase-like 1, mitochondrial [Prototheca wickerhamii]|uniref:Gamma carbonic anhydrase-like 1, mitochondrial n=1 Tax=Prototheca wickerhamii TaxID=3111 RepID=A0AAD9MLV1_PROWI|nr:Gamma carbonic anhydrase-like 1, mitochondrial [Prototheca wickerhamii]
MMNQVSLNKKLMLSVLKACGDLFEEVYNRQRQLVPLGQRVPTLAPDAWVAPNAVLIGDVDLYDRVSVWHGAVLRGDLNTIKIGSFSNVLEGAVIHAASSSPTGLPAATVIGHHVTVGQGALLRSVTVQDQVVIGDKCVLLEGSLVEKQSVLAPGSVLPPGRRVPSGELWAGAPARRVRKLTKDEIHGIVPPGRQLCAARQRRRRGVCAPRRRGGGGRRAARAAQAGRGPEGGRRPGRWQPPAPRSPFPGTPRTDA